MISMEISPRTLLGISTTPAILTVKATSSEARYGSPPYGISKRVKSCPMIMGMPSMMTISNTRADAALINVLATSFHRMIGQNSEGD